MSSDRLLYLLDTNVCIVYLKGKSSNEERQGRQEDKGTREKLTAIKTKEISVYLIVMSLKKLFMEEV